jgi:hypothetical protein
VALIYPICVDDSLGVNACRFGVEHFNGCLYASGLGVEPLLVKLVFLLD